MHQFYIFLNVLMLARWYELTRSKRVATLKNLKEGIMKCWNECTTNYISALSMYLYIRLHVSTYQSVIFRPTWQTKSLVLCTNWDPYMFTLIKYIKSGKLNFQLHFIYVNI
jgi:hypothetical protein